MDRRSAANGHLAEHEEQITLRDASAGQNGKHTGQSYGWRCASSEGEAAQVKDAALAEPPPVAKKPKRIFEVWHAVQGSEEGFSREKAQEAQKELRLKWGNEWDEKKEKYLPAWQKRQRQNQ